MADLNNKINDEALDEVTGGKLNTGLKHLPRSGGSGSIHTSGSANWRPVRCSVQSGYLALRSHPSYNYNNELCAIYNGENFVAASNITSGAYVWARYNGYEGWVNSNYIIWL